jgi:hypothetical protein
MERAYWLGRKRESLANAQRAATSTSRLIHFDLAGRYSVKAVAAGPAASPKAAPLAMSLPQPGAGDAEHYRQLETGARWLAGQAPDEAERQEHLAMAGRYARLRRDAGAAVRR